MLLKNGTCVCPNGWFAITPYSCQACNRLCGTCFGSSADNCLSCTIANTILTTNNTCSCIDGLFPDNSGVCRQRMIYWLTTTRTGSSDIL